MNWGEETNIVNSICIEHIALNFMLKCLNAVATAAVAVAFDRCV